MRDCLNGKVERRLVADRRGSTGDGVATPTTHARANSGAPSPGGGNEAPSAPSTHGSTRARRRSPSDMSELPFRILPQLTDTNRHFWTSGEDGRLRFLRCEECRYLIHPPAPVCPRDLSKNVAPHAVSGRATVATFTVNHQPWMPGPELPYVVAIVEIEEQPSLRLTTNIVHCTPDEVFIGMPVRVVFEKREARGGDLWIPLFEPARQ